MKKKMIEKQLGRCIALAMAAMLTMTGCGAKGTPETAAEETTAVETQVADDNGAVENTDGNLMTETSAYLASLREKYGENDANSEYSGEVMSLNRDESIQIELGYNPWNNEISMQDSFCVYQDKELTQKLEMYGYNWDMDTNILTINPPAVGVAEIDSSDYVDVSDLKGTCMYEDEGDAWGNLSQYYFVTNVDTKTGKKLAKPSVTMMRVNSELKNAPQAKFGVTDEGKARVSWNKVEGADEYLVFMIMDWKDDGLAGYLKPLARTKDTEWICESFMGEPTDENDDDFIGALIMNQLFEQYFISEDSVQGDFAKENADFGSAWTDKIGVIAVGKNGASPISNLMSAQEFSHLLPNTMAWNTNSDDHVGAVYNSVLELPETASITMCDGTLAQRVLIYDFENIRETEYYINIKGSANNTQFDFNFEIYNPDKATLKKDMETIAARQEALLGKGGSVTNNISFDDDQALEDAEKQSEQKDTKEDSASNTKENAEESTSKASDTETAENEEEKKPEEEDTQDVAKAENVEENKDQDEVEELAKETENEAPEAEEEKQEETREPEAPKMETPLKTARKITANSALSEYLATQMLQTKEQIDLSAFSEAADMSVVSDAFFEAQYQNPLVLGVQGANMNSGSRVLQVKYNDDAQTTASKQKQIEEKVNSIVAEIITPGMSDVEKETAINEYLCKNAEYDHAALESAKANDYKSVDPAYNDSFTAYGILVKNLGVCASYSASFKLLADAADLESIVVTGYLNGNLAHAWNKVKIDGQWNILDVTNNDNENVPNALFNLSDQAAWSVLSQDDVFALDARLYDYSAGSDEKEFYHTQNKFFDQNAIVDQLAAEMQSGKDAVFRTDYNIDDTTFTQIAKSVVNKTGKNMKGYYWLGVVHLEEQ